MPQKIIAVGDPDRVAMVSRYFDKVDFKVRRREFVSHGGTFQGKDVLAISTGIGPDNVEIMLTELDALVNVDLKTRLAKTNPTRLSIVRVGTSGALQAEIAPGSELVSATAVGLDNLMNFYSLQQTKSETEITAGIQQTTGLSFLPYMADCSSALLDKIGFDMTKGNTVTCPGFYAPQGRQVRLAIRYPNLLDHLTAFRFGNFRLTNFEMETSTYYAFGQLLGHDMLSTNSILVNRAKNEFAAKAEESVDGLIRKVLERI
jgi:uridine phosphorylase